MNHCPESERIEAWLDRELNPGAAAAFERHLVGCDRCAAEARALESLYESLRAVPSWDPGPSLTERILDHVAPSRVWRRQLTVLGWCYTGVSAVTTFAFISWIVRPETHVWLGRLMIDTGLFALDTLMMTATRLQRGWSLVEVLGGWMMPVARALGTLASDPAIALALWGSVAGCTAVLWWLRPRPVRILRGRDRHVGILAL